MPQTHTRPAEVPLDPPEDRLVRPGFRAERRSFGNEDDMEGRMSHRRDPAVRPAPPKP
jgi:hypothetical protein